MSKKLTAAERQEKADRAVELSAKGWSNSEIGADLGVHRHTVKKLIDDELAKRAEHREHEKEAAIAVYQAIIAEGWRRLADLKDSRSHNASGFLNSIKAAQDSINKITGAEAPFKYHVEVDEEYEVVWDDADEATLSGSG